MEQAGLFVEGFVYRWNEVIFFWTEWDSSECISPGCHSDKLNSVGDLLLNDILIGVILHNCSFVRDIRQSVPLQCVILLIVILLKNILLHVILHNAI